VHVSSPQRTDEKDVLVFLRLQWLCTSLSFSLESTVTIVSEELHIILGKSLLQIQQGGRLWYFDALQ